jgi:hypothetical protein
MIFDVFCDHTTGSYYEFVDVLSKYLIQAQPVWSLVHYTQLSEPQ